MHVDSPCSIQWQHVVLNPWGYTPWALVTVEDEDSFGFRTKSFSPQMRSRIQQKLKNMNLNVRKGHILLGVWDEILKSYNFELFVLHSLKVFVVCFSLDFARLRHIRCAYEYGVPQASGELYSGDGIYTDAVWDAERHLEWKFEMSIWHRLFGGPKKTQPTKMWLWPGAKIHWEIAGCVPKAKADDSACIFDELHKFKGWKVSKDKKIIENANLKNH